MSVVPSYPLLIMHDADPVSEFDPGRILSILNKRGVRYIVFGSLAARVNGAVPRPHDVDVIVLPSQGNLFQVVMALDDMQSGVGFASNAGVWLQKLCEQDGFTIGTPWGELDLHCTDLANFSVETYLALEAASQRVEFEEDVSCYVFSLELLIAFHEELADAKARRAVPSLQATLDYLTYGSNEPEHPTVGGESLTL